MKSQQDKFKLELVEKLGNVSVQFTENFPDKGFTFRVGTAEFLIPVSDNINMEEEREKLEKEKEYLEGFLNSVRRKLSNEKFVKGAPEAVVKDERKKKAEANKKRACVGDE